MKGTVVLNAMPLGLVTQRPGRAPEADACQQWLRDLALKGWDVCLPEIVDYEVRRELTRSGKTVSLARLDKLIAQVNYLPVSTSAMRLASDLWAQARNGGWATADPHALDGDVILAAQALNLSPMPSGLVVATGNVAHLSRYLPAREWRTIVP